ncbi:helix-turn-helix domain-containing protein [Marinifilum sp. D714]|uniref:helix-turn-helix domain-containing protein n=1 Tax=Marinifilum sp. D714 TaxID=2937523 RepID=UPI0027C226E5|nr:helix-turn-helix transcriptional regulator [Marinifilum sp. D714]MDQ2178757.1 helix-turn-helix domain-containing protein [Marinifilum sp. D714]
MTIEEKFGAVLKSVRVSRGISQEKLAFNVDLHRTYIGSVERGERNISLKNINLICSALEISLSDFFKEVENID